MNLESRITQQITTRGEVKTWAKDANVLDHEQLEQFGGQMTPTGTITAEPQHRITSLEELEHLPLLLTVSEAVQISGLSEAHVRRQLRTGAIRGSKIGEAWRVLRDPFLKMCGLAEG